MSELNSRQWALYNHLKEKGEEWTLQAFCAAAIPEYNYDGEEDFKDFHNSTARHLMTDDIRAINHSDVIQKIIISSPKGIKLASKDDFAGYLKRQYAALWRRKQRIDKIAKKGLTDGQLRLIFGGEREIIHAFTDSNEYGDTLKAARLLLGYKQKEVVNLLKSQGIKIDLPMYSRFETGVAIPPVEIREAIKNLFE